MSTIDLPAGTDAPASPEPDETRRRVLARIRDLHQQAGALARVHRTNAALYARARRAFGSWREAVVAAGIDYEQELHQSLRRGLLLRDQRRAARAAAAGG